MFTYFPLGDSSFIVKVGNDISVESHRKIIAFAKKMSKSKNAGIIELVPAYNELLVHYNPQILPYNKLLDIFKEIEANLNISKSYTSELLHIPVCYNDEFSPDIEIVAKRNKLTVNEVIRIHTSKEYLVYMLGFTPGFCYLGGLDERIATPRKDAPRQLIEAGSVGIAGSQTGIYPIDSPGGWQIIGKTPLKLFNPESKPEFLIEAGNYLKFEAINISQFRKIEESISNGTYQVKREKRNG